MMDDLTVRLIVVGSAAALVVIVAVLTGRRPRVRRSIDDTGLPAGIYLFTSGGCGQCAEARDRLAGVVGESGYTEVPWENEPATFERLGVGQAPSTLVVGPDGSGTWYAGVPNRVSLNP
jgi:hypothetical protein